MSDQTETEIQRGQDAAQLLAHPLLAEAFAIIEADLIEKWQTSPARDVKARETLYLSQLLLRRLEGQLQLVVETGQVAAATLTQRIGQTLRRGFYN